MTTIDLTEKYVLGNYGRFPVSISRGEGSWIWDEDGKKYLDFGSGIAVCSLGHSPPCMIRALAEQSEKLIHCSNLYHIRPQADLAEFIVETVVGIPGKVFFANSGAEINDAAVKLARKHFFDLNGDNHRHEVITFRNSFHGRTLGGIASTGQDKVKKGFDPLLPGFTHVPFNDSESLKGAVTDRTAAIMLEPVQGEGGIHVASSEFLATAAQLREAHGLLIIFDEVQCGFGRTGNWCGWRSLPGLSEKPIEPDVITWAKGMAGGFPMGAMWIDDRFAGALGPGTHGSTFGGTPLGATVARAVLGEIESSGCIDEIPRKEQKIRSAVENWNHPAVGELRGAGLMLGFVISDRVCVPEGTTASLHVVRKLMDAGLLTVPAGPDVVRWLPPLNVTDEEIEIALDRMLGVLNELEIKS